MWKTLGIVDVIAYLANHPSRCVFRRFGRVPFLEWILRRVSDPQLLEQLVVLMPEGEDAYRAARLVPSDVHMIRMPLERDAVSRLYELQRVMPARGLLRIHLDSPFLDPSLVDRLIASAWGHRIEEPAGRVRRAPGGPTSSELDGPPQEDEVAEAAPACDYAAFCSNSGPWSVRNRIGGICEWIPSRIVADLNRRVQGPERNDIMGYLCGHPERYRLRLVPLPTELDRPDVRLAVEGEEDWDHAQMIFEALGPDALDWQQIAGLLRDHPTIRERMSLLNQQRSLSTTQADGTEIPITDDWARSQGSHAPPRSK